MRKLKFLFLIAGVVAFLIGLALLSKRYQARATTESKNRPVPSIPSLSSASSHRPAGPTGAARSGFASKPAPVSAPQGLSPEQLKPVTIRVGQVLAIVNGVSITGKDLLPFGAYDPNAQQSMTTAMYDFLLDQAIGRELTFQAAGAQRIELNDQQRRQLDQLRNTMERRFGGDPLLVVNLDISGTVEDQIAFRSREATATLLMASLLDKAGAPSPMVSEDQVREYYNQHVQQYGGLPSDSNKRQEAWEQIDFQVRLDLAFPALEQYSRRRLQYLQQLKSSAQITIYQPSS